MRERVEASRSTNGERKPCEEDEGCDRRQPGVENDLAPLVVPIEIRRLVELSQYARPVRSQQRRQRKQETDEATEVADLARETHGDFSPRTANTSWPLIFRGRSST